MGKRELLIAVAFIVVGAVVFQFTAPADKEGRGFSFSRFLDNARRELRSDSASATTVVPGTLPAPASLRGLRIAGVSRTVRVVGEDREDIAYELTISSTGPDEATALQYAKQTTITQDDLGDTMALRVNYPQAARQTTAIVLKMPSRLMLRIEAGNTGPAGVDVSDVASLQLEGIVGDTTIARVSGSLTGTHRSGDLKVTDVGSVKLTLQRSKSRFENIAHGLTLDLRSGTCEVVSSHGPLELDEQAVDVTISGHAGPVSVRGSDGQVTLTDPRDESRIDVRRAGVTVTLSAAVPVTVITTDDPIRLQLDGPPKILLDAVASAGKVEASDFDLHAEVGDKDSRLTHAFGGAGAPRVSLRTTRGAIVIAKPGAKAEKGT